MYSPKIKGIFLLSQSQGMVYKEVSGTDYDQVKALFNGAGATIKDYFDQFPRGLLEDIPPTPSLPQRIKNNAEPVETCSICCLV